MLLTQRNHKREADIFKQNANKLVVFQAKTESKKFQAAPLPSGEHKGGFSGLDALWSVVMCFLHSRAPQENRDEITLVQRLPKDIKWPGYGDVTK